VRIFGVVGWKNTGKTGLVTRLVAHLSGLGFKVSTALGDPTIQAVASDVAIDDLNVPVFDLDDTDTIAGFIMEQTGLRSP